jgi:energy-coupling factor transport system substrate-specific component
MNQVSMDSLSIKDYITIAIMVVLIYIIYAVVGTPIGMTLIGYIFVQGICSIPLGIIMMLLYTKVNKKGVIFVTGLFIALIMLTAFWGTSICILIGAIIGEVIWRKFDKTRFSTLVIVYVIQMVGWYMGSVLPLIVLREVFISSMSGYSEFLTGVSKLVAGPMFFAGLMGAIIGPVMGALLGKRSLKKHFYKAGIV